MSTRKLSSDGKKTRTEKKGILTRNLTGFMPGASKETILRSAMLLSNASTKYVYYLPPKIYIVLNKQDLKLESLQSTVATSKLQ